MCTGEALSATMTLTVDTYASVPSWIQYTRNPGVSMNFTLTPSGLNAGIYPVRVTYTDTYTGGFIDATFIIDVIPRPLIAAPSITTTCSSDIMPMTIGVYSS